MLLETGGRECPLKLSHTIAGLITPVFPADALPQIATG